MRQLTESIGGTGARRVGGAYPLQPGVERAAGYDVLNEGKVGGNVVDRVAREQSPGGWVLRVLVRPWHVQRPGWRAGRVRVERGGQCSSAALRLRITPSWVRIIDPSG